jgi:FKBP-type peptidyl-prolyl cis-trans isomerase FkpA
MSFGSRSFRLRARVALLLLLASVTGCLDDSPTGPIDPEDLAFAASLDVELSRMTRTASGLYLEDEELGSGAEAVLGSTVIVHYTGWLPDGRKFGSSHDPPGTPLSIGPLGSTTLIRGFDEGLRGMRVGGHRLLVIPSHLGYGSGGTTDGVIPRYATLIFRVELLEVE